MKYTIEVVDDVCVETLEFPNGDQFTKKSERTDYGCRCLDDDFSEQMERVGWKNDVVGRERAYALWNWYRLPEWIIDIAERLRMVQIENRPALEVINRFNHDGVFMYIDPPYLLGTKAGKQYKHEMTDAEHEEMLKELLQSKAKVMISGYESEMYNDYLKDWNKKIFDSCAEHGKPRTEVVWMNYSNTQLSFADFPEVLP